MKRRTALFAGVLLLGVAPMVSAEGVVSTHAAGAATHAHVDCVNNRFMCTEVWDSEAVFGEDVHVGHDEPSLLFYSNVPGAGNRVRYSGILPKEPPATNP